MMRRVLSLVLLGSLVLAFVPASGGQDECVIQGARSAAAEGAIGASCVFTAVNEPHRYAGGISAFRLFLDTNRNGRLNEGEVVLALYNPADPTAGGPPVGTFTVETGTQVTLHVLGNCSPQIGCGWAGMFYAR